MKTRNVNERKSILKREKCCNSEKLKATILMGTNCMHSEEEIWSVLFTASLAANLGQDIAGTQPDLWASF